MLDPRTTTSGPYSSSASSPPIGPEPKPIPKDEPTFIQKVKGNFFYKFGAAFVPLSLIALTVATVAFGIFALSSYLPAVVAGCLLVAKWSILMAGILIVAALIFVALRELGNLVFAKANETIIAA